MARNENNSTLYLVGNVGSEKTIILQYWNQFKSCWNTFQAFRTAPGEFTTASGKTGKFVEKPLTHEEAREHEKIEIPVNNAARYPWRDCKASRDYCQKLLDAGKDKEFIREALSAMFPLAVNTQDEKQNPFDQLN